MQKKQPKREKTYTAGQIAEYMLFKAAEEGKPITNKKLQKLVYYSQAWSLALNGKRLFKEKIEAWVHGPAIRSLYGTYKRYGFNVIDKKIDTDLVKSISKDDKLFLDRIWKVYGRFDSIYLELLTHSESPWQEARQGLEAHENSDAEITVSSMKNYYTEKLAKAKRKK